MYLHSENAKTETISPIASLLVARLAELGYGVSEKLLKQLNGAPVNILQDVLDQVRGISGVNKNWTPLVKGWDTPTRESLFDHFVTFFANLFQTEGTRLRCGHIIPEGTFPLERYNGCPYCGTPFNISELKLRKQGSSLIVLELWTDADLDEHYKNLLASRTALDATQADSLKTLLQEKEMPATDVQMRETLMLVVDTLCKSNKIKQSGELLKTPNDIMRFLWYRKTGLLQIVEPKTIVRRSSKNHSHLAAALDTSVIEKLNALQAVKLKYSRPDCAMVAFWMNNLEMDVEAICENMHPKRDMWVRFIRALRLAEYSKKPGFAKLAVVLDKFYNEDYKVHASSISESRMKYDVDSAMRLLKNRPGLFARSLFANMLWFGADIVVANFQEVADRVPMRLLLTLQMYAMDYFDKNHKRAVRPLGGVVKTVGANPLVSFYDEKSLMSMQDAVKKVCISEIARRFKVIGSENKTMYIDPALFNVPLSIGERSHSIQDGSSALQGTRFKVEGDVVRLFMQWGAGMKAQRLDMDLSCRVVYKETSAVCSFSSLNIPGCKHSGDIRAIPESVGTAEYININVQELKNAGALYVVFTCNAYSGGAIVPNMVVGWMNSRYPMEISAKSGVAYDPSCVEHQVKITSKLDKGLVFGVLDIGLMEIIWMEMPFQGQIVQQLNYNGVTALVKKLKNRITVGELLKIKAEAQHMTILDTSEADEVYSERWSKDTAAVTNLLMD